MGYKVAVVGATGAVGHEMLSTLAEREFPADEVVALASDRSVGREVSYGEDDTLSVQTLESFDFNGVDIALFSPGAKVSAVFAPKAAKAGAVVIDNTSHFRMEPDVPLVVPEVNPHAIAQFPKRRIIANPNCSTIQMVVALKPLHDRYGISRIIVSTYQAVSGAGAKAIAEMYRQTKDLINGDDAKPDILPVGSLPVKHQIAFNAIPQIDKFLENGFTNEEMKMTRETKKIMGDDSIEVSATCVRIPVAYGHSESVYVEFKQDFDLEEVKSLLANAPGVVLQDDPETQLYPLATTSAGKIDTFVGRIRRDLSHPRGLHMWIVSDNLLKGAAWNAVQIAEYIALEQ